MFFRKTFKEIRDRFDSCDANTESIKETAASRLSSLDRRVLELEQDFAEEIIGLQDRIADLNVLLASLAETHPNRQRLEGVYAKLSEEAKRTND